MDRARMVIGLVGAGLVAGSAYADTWTVPSADTPTLQFALESGSSPVQDGDTIELTEAGFYQTTYTVSTPNLTIKAAAGQNITIDGLGLGSVFTLAADGLTLEDLTITGGAADPDGGAVKDFGYDLTAINCTFTGNHSTDDGPAMVLQDCTVLIGNCTFTDNHAAGTNGDGSGGAIQTVRCDLTVIDSTFSGNTAHAGGGALQITTSSTLTMSGCTITGNSTMSVGGGIWYLGGSDGVISDTLIMGNDCTNDGGGVRVSDSWPTFLRCRVLENTATSGGGIFVSGETGPEVTMTSCLIAGNEGTSQGGGFIASTGPDPTLYNCTIVGNIAGASAGGGVKNIGGAAGTFVRNCIIRGNVPDQYPTASTTVATYCNVEGGIGGSTNVDVDPMFVDPNGTDGDPMTFLDNDYRLSPGSPSIDAGDSTLLAAEYPVDLDLNNRVVDDPATSNTGIAIFFQTVDQGAYEYQPPTGAPPPVCNGADINGDGSVDVFDFGVFVLNFGCSGP